MIKIRSLETAVYRYPLKTPVQTSFGIMRDRPMVLVKLLDDEGVTGIGEIWCNFPSVGAEHRANLVNSIFSPLLSSHTFESPEDAFDYLTKNTWVLGLQTGEFGPLAQSIAGIDIALNDLFARKLSKPLWEFYGGKKSEVPIYASGINPKGAEKMAENALDKGFKALKLKIGFDKKKDIQNIKSLKTLVGENEKLMTDANQAWDVNEALQMMDKISEYNLSWLEEPIPVDRPSDEWRKLHETGTTPLAGGENVMGVQGFNSLLSEGVLDVIQPDLAKWGGLTKTIPVAQKILSSRKSYCPHYLGGGVGLVASAHALAAVGGNGMLEVDFNNNPLRSLIVDPMLDKSSGSMELGKGFGLGIEFDFKQIEEFRVL